MFIFSGILVMVICFRSKFYAINKLFYFKNHWRWKFDQNIQGMWVPSSVEEYIICVTVLKVRISYPRKNFLTIEDINDDWFQNKSMSIFSTFQTCFKSSNSATFDNCRFHWYFFSAALTASRHAAAHLRRSDWSRVMMWPGCWTLIGQKWSWDLVACLWLVGCDNLRCSYESLCSYWVKCNNSPDVLIAKIDRIHKNIIFKVSILYLYSRFLAINLKYFRSTYIQIYYPPILKVFLID